MDHKAKGHRHHHIKAPGNRPPVEQRIGGSPILNRAHGSQVRLPSVQHPLAEGVKHNIRRQPCGKHHGTPLEEGILRLIKISQPDLSKAGKSHIEGTDQGPQADQQIVGAHLIPQKETDGAQNRGGAHRIRHKEQAQHGHAHKGQNRGDPVQALERAASGCKVCLLFHANSSCNMFNIIIFLNLLNIIARLLQKIKVFPQSFPGMTIIL